MSDPRLEPCPHCSGAGRIDLGVEWDSERWLRCPACGGHRTIPAADSGPVWFYQGVDWRGRRGYLSQRAAVVTPEPDGRWRVTYYGPDGPCRHEIERREEAFGRLYDYRRTPFGARAVDGWSRTAVWARGLKRLAYVEYQSVLADIPAARQALYAAMDAAGNDLDAMLATCRALKARHAPEAALWG